MGDGNLAVERIREARYGGHPVSLPQVSLNNVDDDDDLGTPFECPKQELGEADMQLKEEIQRNKELRAQIQSLFSEQSSLQGESTQLERELLKL